MAIICFLDEPFNYFLNSNIDGITGFSEEDSQSIISFMKLAVQLSKSTGHSVTILFFLVIVSHWKAFSLADCILALFIYFHLLMP